MIQTNKNSLLLFIEKIRFDKILVIHGLILVFSLHESKNPFEWYQVALNLWIFHTSYEHFIPFILILSPIFRHNLDIQIDFTQSNCAITCGITLKTSLIVFAWSFHSMLISLKSVQFLSLCIYVCVLIIVLLYTCAKRVFQKGIYFL